MNFLLLIFVLIIAIVDWIAVAWNWRKVEYIAKPAVMILLLIWFGQSTGFKGHLIWFALGLVFSLAGDVFLVLPKEQFLLGLISFLLGQLAYIVGFNSTFPPVNLPTLILTLLVAATAFQIYRRIAAGLKSGGYESLKIPVLVYTTVISIMVLSALFTLTRTEWQPLHAIIVAGGALLFFFSDTILAWNRFVEPIPNGRLINMIAYHAGQLLIALGAAAHFIKQ
jgi:uncharacterized membrane protein YhhN